MANTNAPFGLRFVGYKGSPPTNSAIRERRNGILYSGTTAIYTGDLIKKSADGYLYQYTSGSSAYLVQGVFAGCRYASNSQQTIVPSKYYPGTDAASGTILAQYEDCSLAPSALYVIQTDATGVVLADIGMNFDVIVGSGSTLTGRSGTYLSVTSITTAVTAPLQLVDLWTNWSMGNSPTGAGTSSTLAPGTQAGAYNWAVVAINNGGNEGI